MINKFFKPTWRKIILTIILTLIIIYYIRSIIVMCLFSPPCLGGKGLYSPPLLPGCPICLGEIGIILSFIIPLFVYLTFSYFISCLIIFIIDKLIKRKRKK